MEFWTHELFMLFWKSNWWYHLLFFCFQKKHKVVLISFMYLFFSVQDTVLRASPGVCLCCYSDCYAATKKMLNNFDSVFFDRKSFLCVCVFPNKNELLPVFPCSPLVALQAPLFFSVLAGELPQFQQQGRLLAKPPPPAPSSGTTHQFWAGDEGAAVRQQAKAQQAAGAKNELFKAALIKIRYLNVPTDRMLPEKKQKLLLFFIIIIYTVLGCSRRSCSVDIFRGYLVTVLLTFTNRYSEARGKTVVVSKTPIIF